MSREELDAIARPAALCAFCPKLCRSACPVSETEGRETVTPWGKMSVLHLAREGTLALDDDDVKDALHSCTGCGACKEQCAHGTPVGDLLYFARGTEPGDAHHDVIDAFAESGNAARKPLTEALSSFSTATSGEVGYFPGCQRLDGADVDDSPMARDLEALRMATGGDVPVVALTPALHCCGQPLLAHGAWDAFVSHTQALSTVLSGFDTVVTPDPDCAQALTQMRQGLLDDDELGDFPRVVTLVEVLAPYAEAFAGNSKGMRVKYHDPCSLSRKRGVVVEPRQLLRAATGLPVVEFANAKAKTDCSGGGGVYPDTHPEAAVRMARRRVEHDATPDDYDVVATACPSALRQFRRAQIPAVSVVDVLLGRTDVHDG